MEEKNNANFDKKKNMSFWQKTKYVLLGKSPKDHEKSAESTDSEKSAHQTEPIADMQNSGHLDPILQTPNNDSASKNAELKLRVKKAGRISAMIAKSTIWNPLKIILAVLWKGFSYLINIFFTFILVGVITGVVVSCAFVLYIQNYIDSDYDGLDNLKFDSSLNTTICYVDSNGKEVTMEDDTLHSGENRLWSNYNEIPQKLIEAVICIEDQRFYEHKGVDIKRTLGAVLNFFLPGGDSYGGSTITQQLIKNVSR
ncbi:MAG: transglycosylase domain-containing protein, partial [Clostridia bacterium]